MHGTPGPFCTLPFGLFFSRYCNYLFRETQTNKVDKTKQKQNNSADISYFGGLCQW